MELTVLFAGFILFTAYIFFSLGRAQGKTDGYLEGTQVSKDLFLSATDIMAATVSEVYFPKDPIALKNIKDLMIKAILKDAIKDMQQLQTKRVTK